MIGAISVIEVRFAIALVLVLFSSVYKGYSTKANLVAALAILYIAFGMNNMVYLVISVFLNFILLWMRLANTYAITALNIMNVYLYKTIGHSVEPRIGKTFDITGFLMVLTIKMGYLARDYDGRLSNAFNYIFFIPGLLTGPTTQYKEFVERDKSKRVPFPVYSFAKAFGYFAIYLSLQNYEFKPKILNPKNSFLERLVYTYLYNVVHRCKYHFAWNWAHCCFILNNLPEFLNIDFVKVELTESVREIASNWNRFVSRWLKELFFLPIKDRSMMLSVLITYFVSAALHGFNICHIIFFLSFGLYSDSITQANRMLKYRPLKILQMVGFVTYFSMAFYLTDIKELYGIWKSIYFYGHIYCTALLIYFNVLKLTKSVNIVPGNKSD